MAGDRTEMVCDKGCGSRQRQATAWKKNDEKRQSLRAAATVKASGKKNIIQPKRISGKFRV